MNSMPLAAADKISLGEAAVDFLLGYGVVFLGLVLLLAVVTLLGKIMTAKKPAPAAPVQETAPVQVAAAEPAKGTAGEIKLNNVPEREAAMVMAVVAYRLGKPLNELRFRSIKEVKDE